MYLLGAPINSSRHQEATGPQPYFYYDVHFTATIFIWKSFLENRLLIEMQHTSGGGYRQLYLWGNKSEADTVVASKEGAGHPVLLSMDMHVQRPSGVQAEAGIK